MTIATDANALFTSLTSDLSITIPDIDLTDPLLQIPASLTDEMYQHITGPENVDLTTRVVGGAGIFDALMASTSAHLKAEFDKGRITGAEYTKAYIDLTQISMQSAVAFALGKAQAFWAAQAAQIAAISGRVQLEAVKVSLAKLRIEAVTSEALYAQAKIGLLTASVQYDTAQYNLANLLPAQLAHTTAETATAAYTLSTVLPAQVVLSAAQAALTNAQKTVADGQVLMVAEQREAQRAQTLDTRTDGTGVTGLLGKQKALYSQQITSYQRDAEVKAAKLFADAWTVQKTVDDGLTAPTGFTNSSVDTVLTVIKNNNGLV